MPYKEVLISDFFALSSSKMRSAGETTLYLETYLYDHASMWGEKCYEQGLHVQYPRSEFFVQMIDYNKDRQRPSTDSRRGQPSIPVLYDSRQAYITFEDGSRLNARPEVYLGANKIYDFPSVSKQAARPSPYDINSDEVHRMIPKLTHNKRYGSAYVIFQTNKFNADSKWTIHLGSQQIQGRKVEIPPRRQKKARRSGQELSRRDSLDTAHCVVKIK
ncbi:hypothetical protein [Pseudomonas putida]|uniref:hypothetical protein n=1 Tax=Pseudomonas putida TaxID=303 RepID=UPI00300E8EC7